MIRVLKTFTGYPNETAEFGKVVSGPMSEFIAGQTVKTLKPAYEKLLIEKGLAESADKAAPDDAPATATDADGDPLPSRGDTTLE